MAARAYNLFGVLSELLASERELAQGYVAAVYLASNGALTEEARNDFHAIRDQVYTAETLIYTMIRSALEPLGQADRLDAPTRFPDLPAAGSAEVPTGAAGLGAIPLVLWVLLVFDLVLKVAIILAAVRLIEVGYDTAIAIYNARENTARYRVQVQSEESRFNSCVRRTGNVAQCAELFPAPTPPLELPPPRRTDPLVLATGIGATALSLGFLGWLGWKAYQSDSAPHHVDRRRGRPRRVSSRDVSRRLLADRED